MTMGETWVPSMAPPDKKAVQKAKTAGGTLKRIIVIAVMGWYVYLFTNETGAKENKGQSHFNPSSKALFKPKDRPYAPRTPNGQTQMLQMRPSHTRLSTTPRRGRGAGM